MKSIISIFLIALSLPVHAFTIIASGQSNMCGRGTNGPSPLTANPLVRVWNNSNEPVNLDGDQFISAPDFGSSPWSPGGGNNLALWFADAAADALNEPVYLVLVCHGARSIDTWASDGEMYTATKRVYELTELPPADVFLWLQGNGDSKTMSSCSYKLKFLNLLARMKAEGLLAYSAPAIVGTILEEGSDIAAEVAFNNMLYGLALAHPDILFVNADGTPAHDTVHFSGQGLHDLGVKYWDKYSQ